MKKQTFSYSSAFRSQSRTVSKTLKYLSIFGVILFISACVSLNSNQGLSSSQKSIATSFYSALYSIDQPSIDGFIDNNYEEHQIGSGFTFDGLKKYAQDRVKSNTDHNIKIHRIIEEGDYVFIQAEETFADKRIVRGDLFRFDSGKITEHWGNVQAHPASTKSGNSMFGGPQVNYASTAGKKYKDVFRVDDEAMFNELSYEKASRNRHTTYLQHNPFIDNGKEQLKNWFGYIKSDGASFNVTNKIIIAEGDFIVELNHFVTNQGKTQKANDQIIFDFVRVREDGKADAHWDIVEDLNGADAKKVF